MCKIDDLPGFCYQMLPVCQSENPHFFMVPVAFFKALSAGTGTPSSSRPGVLRYHLGDPKSAHPGVNLHFHSLGMPW